MSRLEKLRFFLAAAFIICIFVECCGPSVALRGLSHDPGDMGSHRYQHSDSASDTITRINIEHDGYGLGVNGSATVVLVSKSEYDSVNLESGFYTGEEDTGFSCPDVIFNILRERDLILDERHYGVNDHETFFVHSYLSLVDLDDDPALELLVHQTHVPLIARTATVTPGTIIVDTENGQIVERPVSFLRGMLLITHKRRAAEILIFSALSLLLICLYERRNQRRISSASQIANREKTTKADA